MSEWNVDLVRIGEIEPHPQADALDITTVYGQNVITKRGTYKTGDLAVFLPPDSVLPNDPNHPLVVDSGLPYGHCIEAKKLRGIFSNGMLVPASVCFTEEELATIEVGTNVAERIGVTKYVESDEAMSTRGENERDNGFMPVYTDMESWPKNRHNGSINEGDEVVLLEKLHGANARYAFRDDRLWVGSRTCVKKFHESNMWWKVALELGLEERFKFLLSGQYNSTADQEKPGRAGRRAARFTKEDALNGVNLEGTVLYGEVFGQVQKGYDYGQQQGKSNFRIFDSYNPSLGRYNDWDVTVAIADVMGLETVPVLYRGKWKPELEELQNGPESVSGKAIHNREGFVIKPVKEAFYGSNKHNHTGSRVIYKFVGSDYKLKKGKKR